MTEPRRLLDETDSCLERVLLNAGTSYRTEPELRAKTMAALGLAGSAAVVTASTSLSLAPAAKAGWIKLIGTITALGAATSVPVGYYAWQRSHEPEPAPIVVSVSSTVPVAKKSPARLAPSVTEAPAASASSGNAPSAETTRSASRSARNSELAAELGVLDAARSRLAGGDARQALALLDTYARAYPRGRLELEAEVLRIDALAKSGQTEIAKSRARAFVQRHPKSVLATRMRVYLDE